MIKYKENYLTINSSKCFMEDQSWNCMMDESDIYDTCKSRLEKLQRIVEKIDDNRSKYPSGKIRISKKNDYVQYYVRYDTKDKSGKYIKKSDTLLIKKYLQKCYEEKVYSLIKREISTTTKFLKDLDGIKNSIRNTYSDFDDATKAYIIPYDCSDDDYKKYWLGKRFEGKPIYDELPFFETNNNERVRSKSELSIANELALNGIPYKYECPLKFKNGVVIHPDFTILNVKKRKVLFWEHRGLMDERSYAKEAVMRVKEYSQNGIFIGDRLIITEETANSPLTPSEIRAIIKKFFG